MCCSGALFDRARAGADEIERMKNRGLRVFADSTADRFGLPCPMLSGTACTIYEERFSVCRTFECKLLTAANAGTIALEDARGTVAKAKEMIARVSAADPKMVQAEARHRWFREGPPTGDVERGRAFLELLALDQFLDRHFRNKPVNRGFEEFAQK